MKQTIFQNAKMPEYIPTYDGSNQTTHPSILHFPEGWKGWEYWMAITPYPYNNDGYEDPSILVSHDGKKWEVPQGVTNPLTPKPEPGHNCDVDLVYQPKLDELWMYYVEADDVAQSWVKLMRSSDGIHWSSPAPVLHDPTQMYSILSPSIEYLPDGKLHMWYVDTGNGGYKNQHNVVRHRTSEDGLTWSEAGESTLQQPGWQIWHIDVHMDAVNNTLYAFYPAYPNGKNCDYCELFYAAKRPGEGWRVSDRPVLSPGEEGAWDDFCIYRSSCLLENRKLRLWYSGKKKSDASWNLGYTEADEDALAAHLK